MRHPYFAPFCGGAAIIVGVIWLVETLEMHALPCFRSDIAHHVSVELRDPVLEIDLQGAEPTPVCLSSPEEMGLKRCVRSLHDPTRVVLRYAHDNVGPSRDCRGFLPRVNIDDVTYSARPVESSLSRGCVYDIDAYPLLITSSEP